MCVIASPEQVMEFIEGLYRMKDKHSTIKKYFRTEEYLGPDVGK